MTRRLLGAGGVLALLRVATIPLLIAAERLLDHPDARSGPFAVLIAAAALYAVATLVLELAGRPLGSPRTLAIADLLGVAVLVATSGGPFSQLRLAFFLLPVGAAFTLGPRPTLALSGVAVALYGLIALTYPHPERTRGDYVEFELTQLLFLAWMGLAATLLAGLLARRSAEVERLSASRGRLVGQVLDAEDRARRRLAEALHDEALQDVLAVRQLIRSGGDRPQDRDLLVDGLDRSVRQLREAVFDLHPYLLEQAGLETALRAVADHAAERAELSATVEVDPDAVGVHDALLFAVARELVANVAKHARARRMTVRVSREPGAVVLAVGDDGVGLPPDARSAATRGHIGLASTAERAEALGGTFTTGPGPRGRGTEAVVRLPAPSPAAARPPAGRDGELATTGGPPIG